MSHSYGTMDRRLVASCAGRVCGFAALAFVLLTLEPVRAQTARYELGRRVRSMEEAWEAQRDPAVRRAALPPIKRAVENFFALRLPAAARELDETRLILAGHLAPSASEPGSSESRSSELAARRWTAALSFEPARRLIDPGADSKLTVTVRQFYAVPLPTTSKPDAPMRDAPQPAAVKSRLVFTLRSATGEALAKAECEAFSEPPLHATRSAEPRPDNDPNSKVTDEKPMPQAEWRREVSIPLTASLADQDCQLEGIAMIEGQSFPLGTTAVALSTKLADRLATLRIPLASPRSENLLTLQEQLRVLEALAGGRTLETDYPAQRLLTEATARHLAFSAATKPAGDASGTRPGDTAGSNAEPRGAEPRGAGRGEIDMRLTDGTRLAAGQHWRAIVGGQGSSCLTRILIPADAGPVGVKAANAGKLKDGGVAGGGTAGGGVAEGEGVDERRPLVVAVHGAGGSENMFFDAYGAGKIVRLCESRGWLLVAPRQGLLGGIGIRWDELVAGVGRLANVDTRRVYLIGHSLGAMQATRLADAAERKPSYVAALGGGGRVGRFEPLRDVPFFVGVGDQDFGRGGGKQLADLLRRGGVRNVQFREYGDTEHLTIVQVALDDIFRQLDERDAALRDGPGQ